MISILIPSGILLAAYWAWYFLVDRKKGIPLSVPLVFTCLFIPKINLIQVNRTYSTAGIRADDLLALLLLVFALGDARTWKNKKILLGVGFLLAVSIANLVSMFIGRANGYNNNVLFSILTIVRKYEYFAFALVGIYLAGKTERMEAVALREVTVMSVFHVVIGLLQAAGKSNYAVAGVLMDNAFKKGNAVSTFNGYYEYGHFLCFAIVIYLCFFVRACREKSVRKMVFSACMILVSFGMILLTKSRSSVIIALALVVLILLFSIRKVSRLPVKIFAVAGMALMIAVGVLFATGNVKIGRFGKENFGEYAEVLRTNVEHGSLRQYVEVVRSEMPDKAAVQNWISDKSASIRFYKWGAAIDGFRQSPVFGYGTGVTHVMDGNYIKILGENGIVGTVLWLSFFGYFMVIMWREQKTVLFAKSVFWMMVSVVMASLFIDMFEASKPMEMLWLAVGLVLGLSAQRDGTEAERQVKQR